MLDVLEPGRDSQRRTDMRVVLGGLITAILVSCASACGENSQPPSEPGSTLGADSTAIANATTQPQATSSIDADATTAVSTNTAAGSCPVPPADQAPQRGDCTLVDWDVIAVDGASLTLRYYVNDPGCSLELNRVEINETASTVSLNVVVGYTGDEGASCPTAYSSRTSVAKLREPLGSRALAGCRPVGSFVPKGGYNDPEPRTTSAVCLAT